MSKLHRIGFVSCLVLALGAWACGGPDDFPCEEGQACGQGGLAHAEDQAYKCRAICATLYNTRCTAGYGGPPAVALGPHREVYADKVTVLKSEAFAELEKKCTGGTLYEYIDAAPSFGCTRQGPYTSVVGRKKANPDDACDPLN